MAISSTHRRLQHRKCERLRRLFQHVAIDGHLKIPQDRSEHALAAGRVNHGNLLNTSSSSASQMRAITSVVSARCYRRASEDSAGSIGTRPSRWPREPWQSPQHIVVFSIANASDYVGCFSTLLSTGIL